MQVTQSKQKGARLYYDRIVFNTEAPNNFSMWDEN